MRGQALSLDLLLSVSILITAISIFVYFLYSSYYVFSGNSLSLFYLQQYINSITSSNVLNTLLATPGYPGNWYSLPCNKTLTIGLLNGSNDEISYYKLKTLVQYPIGCILEKEGTSSFGMKIMYMNDSPFYIDRTYEIGNTNSLGIVTFAYVYPNNTMVKLIFYI